MKPTRIHFGIDKVVLHGLGPEQGKAVIAGLEAALPSLIADPAFARDVVARHALGLDVATVRRERIRTSAQTKPAELGARVARAIASGIGGPR